MAARVAYSGRYRKIKLTEDEKAAIIAGKTVGMKESVRKCHDCGKLTYNYRCGRCLAEWQRKHHVPVGYQYVSDLDFDF